MTSSEKTATLNPSPPSSSPPEKKATEEAAATASETEPTTTTIPQPSDFLTSLHILPPLQNPNVPSTPSHDSNIDQHIDNIAPSIIPLPPLRPEEPVSSLRAALSEVRGFAHVTHYRLVLENSSTLDDYDNLKSRPSQQQHQQHSTGKNNHPKKNKKKKNINNSNNNSSTTTTTITSVISPYTGPSAMITTPRNAADELDITTTTISTTETKKEVILDDYGDLHPLMEHGLSSGSGFRMILERYDAAGISDHVDRTRMLLDGYCVPYVTSLVEEQQQEHSGGGEVLVEGETTDEVEGGNSGGQTKATNGKEKTNGKDNKQHPPPPPTTTNRTKIPSLSPTTPLLPSPLSDLTNFFTHASATSENPSTTTTPEQEPPKINAIIRYSGFHPPPPHRRHIGDLAYLEVTTPGQNEGVVHVTACVWGFFVNRTRVISGDGGQASYEFDPRPKGTNGESCFSHELLDCLLRRSKSLRSAWAQALTHANLHKPTPTTTLPSPSSPLLPLLRATLSSSTSPSHPDTHILRPSWLLPPHTSSSSPHPYSPHNTESYLTSTYGLDIRSGASPRDWNEELQSARDSLPRDTLDDRIDRARTIYKITADFATAALAGAMAIMDGVIPPMNPNESSRSHVYLHNNIFFSRAVDAGVDTFKLAKGDGAARKSANRDCCCMSLLHKRDVEGLCTLATVLVDYKGVRLVCQSVVPGILHGEKTHELLYGAVEASAELKWDEEFHGVLERALDGGEGMVGTRKVWSFPLEKERMEEMKGDAVDLTNGEMDKMVDYCGPLEAKGIRGSDKRMYVLDVTRLTPRDANWVPKVMGGTGMYEDQYEEFMKVLKGPEREKYEAFVPKELDDDEWTMAVLRPELLSILEKKKVVEAATAAKEAAAAAAAAATVGDKDKENKDDVTNATTKDEPKETDTKTENQPEDDIDDKTKTTSTPPPTSTTYNINVFLPHTRPLPPSPTLTSDEETVRSASSTLYSTILPSLTKELRDGSAGHQIPVDGRQLTDLLHTRGINCRYLGRLAQLAQLEELADKEDDKKGIEDSIDDDENVDPAANGTSSSPKPKKRRYLRRRRLMPLCWLELLEIEMIARSGKHVLDSYLTSETSKAGGGGLTAETPSFVIAPFLSALCSIGEETAAETERRLEKVESDESGGVVGTILSQLGGAGCDETTLFSKSRSDIWNDINRDIGRRFRYVLTQYNNNNNTKDNSSRVKCFIPLLRRICQRCGIRLLAKHYNLGGKALLSSNTMGVECYPIAPGDIRDILPLVKHAACHGNESFLPTHLPSPGSSSYSLTGTGGGQPHPSSANAFLLSPPPSLHILLPDAHAAFDAAHAAWTAGHLPRALDGAQDAANLYQRVLDNTSLHVTIGRCLDLTAVVLFQAREMGLAAANAARALATSVQLYGWDGGGEVMSGHATLAHVLMGGGDVGGAVRHLKAAGYLMEVMAGKRYADLPGVYHKMGTMYHEVGDVETALRFYEIAADGGAFHWSDRMMESMIYKSTALCHVTGGRFKSALASEKKAYATYKDVLGEDHELTLNSANSLKQFMKLAVEQGMKVKIEERERKEEEAARDAGRRVVMEEEIGEEHEKKKKDKKRSKKTKKKKN